MQQYIAIDLGASTGRIIAYNDSDLTKLHELYRFNHRHINNKNGIFLDFNYLLNEIIKGLSKVFELFSNIKSIGICTWGVDYGYIDQDGNLKSNPRFYRSLNIKNVVDDVHKIIDKKTLYNKTGIQHLYFNTIYQMYYDKKNSPNINIKKALMLPDLIAYALTGVARTEITNLSTTSLYSPYTKDFIEEVDKLTYGKNIFPDLIYPGEIYGLTKKEYPFKQTPVVAVATHDTASAIASLPLDEDDMFISSGSWSLLGALLPKPQTSKFAYENNFTNEIGIENKIRFLKNIPGMFISNSCFDEYKKEDLKLTYEKVGELTSKEKPFISFIDVYHPTFESSDNVIEKIKKYCEKTKQPIPNSIGQIYMTIYSSLAMTYLKEINELEKITNKHFKNIYIIGGGSKIEILNQMIASLTNKKVVVGVHEATALGNIIVQMKAMKTIKEYKEGQELLLKLNDKKVYIPQPIDKGEYKRFLKVIERGKEICL